MQNISGLVSKFDQKSAIKGYEFGIHIGCIGIYRKR